MNARAFLAAGPIICSGFRLAIEKEQSQVTGTDPVGRAKAFIDERCVKVRKGATGYYVGMVAAWFFFGLLGLGVVAAVGAGILESNTVIVVMTDIGDLAGVLPEIYRR